LTLTTISLCSVLRCIVLTLAFLTFAARAQIAPGEDYTDAVSPTASFGTKARTDLPFKPVRKSQTLELNSMRKFRVNVHPGISSWPNHIPQE
jgi:hypothetical protein